VVQTPNKQLERTVIRRRVRWTAQRAAAELRRYARLNSHRSFEPLYRYFSAVWLDQR